MARPQKYDREDILNRMKMAFWERGYANISMEDVDRITDMKRGSIYNAFSDKRGLYLEALDFYGKEHYGGAVDLIKQYDSPTEAVRKLFDLAFSDMRGDNPHWGCFMCNAAVELAPSDPEVAALVTKYIKMLTAAFVKLLQEASTSEKNTKRLKQTAENLTATYIGFHVMARSQIPIESLKRVSESAVHAAASYDN